MSGRFYVYLHKTPSGVAFYVGKGTGNRAWSRDRDPTWIQYVSSRLDGVFDVEIVERDLDETEALELEDEWMRRLGSTLVNRQNLHKGMDFTALGRSNALRSRVVETTRLAELASTPAERAQLYGEALAIYADESAIVFERGAFGDALRGMAPLGRYELIKGCVDAFIASGNVAGAQAALTAYDARYTGHKGHTGLIALRARVTRLLTRGAAAPKVSAVVPEFKPPDQLPPDWESVLENGRRVTRLRRSLKQTGDSYLDFIDPSRAHKRAGRYAEALAMMKIAMVAAEAARGPVPPYYANECALLARKLGAHLEECLVLYRYIGHPRAVPAAVPAMIQRLGRANKAWLRVTGDGRPIKG
jgi:hypothetical protein